MRIAYHFQRLCQLSVWNASVTIKVIFTTYFVMFECVQSQIKDNAYKTAKEPNGLAWADPEEAVWPRTHTALLHFP